MVLCDAEIQTRSARLEGFFFSSFFSFVGAVVGGLRLGQREREV